VTSPVLQRWSRILQPAVVAVSVYILLRGHHEPGGGFAGGLIAAAGFSLRVMSDGVEAARRALRVKLHLLIAAGLAMALASAALPVAAGRPVFTSLGTKLPLIGWHVSTSLLFEAGVYTVVLGAMLLTIFTLAED
jgi:multicomponent Na+:H+ antiporter subunit B